MEVYQDIGKDLGTVKGQAWKVWRFSSNEFWNNIGCLVSAPTFGIGVLRMWEKDKAKTISGKKEKISSIMEKVYLYDVCLYYIIYCLIFYIMTTI